MTVSVLHSVDARAFGKFATGLLKQRQQEER